MHRYLAYMYSYHFIAEAIIAFLILLPATFDYYETSHYIAYIGVVLVATCLFFTIEIMQRSSGIFLVIIPITATLFYLLHFPIGLAIFFPILFVWRYMSIQHYERKTMEDTALESRTSLNKANLYIKIALGIAAVGIIYSKQVFAAWYVLVLLFVLYVGYLLSHVSAINKQDQQQMNLRALSIIPIGITAGAAIAVYLFDPFRILAHKFWIALMSAVIFLAGSIVGLIGLLIPEPSRGEGNEGEHTVSGGESWDDSQGGLFEYSPGIDEAILTIVTTIIVIIFIGIFIYRVLNSPRDVVTGRAESAVHYEHMDHQDEKEGFFKRIFSRRRREPEHPVRRLIYTFEKDARQHDLGRYPFESLNEWFGRLHIDLRIDTYQKVRYGNLNVGEQETKELEQQLQEIDLKKMQKREEMYKVGINDAKNN